MSARLTRPAALALATAVTGIGIGFAALSGTPSAAAQGYIPCEQWQAMHPGWPCIDTPTPPPVPPGGPPTVSTPPPLPTHTPGLPNQPGGGGGTGAGALTPPPIAPGNGTPIVPAPGAETPALPGNTPQPPATPGNLPPAPQHAPATPPSAPGQETPLATGAPDTRGDTAPLTTQPVPPHRSDSPPSPVAQATEPDTERGVDGRIPLLLVAGVAAFLAPAFRRGGNASHQLTITKPWEGGEQTFILMTDPTAPREYRFPQQVPPGGQLRTNPDGSVDALDADGAVVSHTRPPWAYDALGRPVTTWYEVNGDTIVQHIDPGPDNVYPILADPDTVPNCSINDTGTATINTGNGSPTTYPASTTPTGTTASQAALLGAMTQTGPTPQQLQPAGPQAPATTGPSSNNSSAPTIDDNAAVLGALTQTQIEQQTVTNGGAATSTLNVTAPNGQTFQGTPTTASDPVDLLTGGAPSTQQQIREHGAFALPDMLAIIEQGGIAPNSTTTLPSGVIVDNTTNQVGDVTVSATTYTAPGHDPIESTRYTRTFHEPFLGEGNSYDVTLDENGNLVSILIHGSNTIDKIWYNADGSYTVFGTDGSTQRFDATGKPLAPLRTGLDDPRGQAARDWVGEIWEASKSSNRLMFNLLGLRGSEGFAEGSRSVGNAATGLTRWLADPNTRADSLVEFGQALVRYDDLVNYGPQYWTTKLGLDIGLAVATGGTVGGEAAAGRAVLRAGEELAQGLGDTVTTGARALPDRPNTTSLPEKWTSPLSSSEIRPELFSRSGPLSNLEVVQSDIGLPRTMETVDYYAGLAGVDFRGAPVAIIDDLDIDTIGYLDFQKAIARTDPLGVQLGPAAFQSEEILVRTLGHESIHVQQYLEGSVSSVTNALEAAAYAAEEGFVEAWRRAAG